GRTGRSDVDWMQEVGEPFPALMAASLDASTRLSWCSSWFVCFVETQAWLTGPIARCDSREHGRDDAIAPIAREPEHVCRGAIDVASQRLAQQRSRAEQPRANRRFGNAERFGRLLHAHVLDFAHHEHRPERHRQFVDPLLEQMTDFSPERAV